jgi:hypothetical protein
VANNFEQECALVHWERPYPAGQFESLKNGHRPIPPRHEGGETRNTLVEPSSR